MVSLVSKLRAHRNSNLLSYRLLFYIVACSTALAVLSTAVQLFWDYRNDRVGIEQGIDNLEAGYLDSLASSLWKLDQEQIAIQLDGIMKLPDIQFASITEIVAGKEETVLSRGIPGSAYPIQRDFELHYQNTLVGHLTVAASLDRVYQRLWEKFLVILGSQAIKTLLVSVCILLIVHYLVVRHLNTMARYTQKLDLDSLDQGLELPAKNPGQAAQRDALDDLAQTLNRMRDNLRQQLSAKRQAQQELEQLNEELEQRVKYRTATLRHTNERLTQTLEELTETQGKLVESEKMAALGELVAGVAHEINTPVGNSITSATFLQETIKELQQALNEGKLTRSAMASYQENLNEAAELIFQNLHRASELIGSFKQIAVDQTSEIPQRFSVCKNLQQTLNTLQHSLKQAGCGVKVNCDQSVEIFSYPGALIQIYTNLVNNSLLHGFEGRGTGQIQIDVELEGSQVAIRYHDNGRGIPEQIRHKLFAPFVTTKRGQGGSGLGTHIIYNLVTQLLGGTINFESERGEGCTFLIRIPNSVPQEKSLEEQH